MLRMLLTITAATIATLGLVGCAKPFVIVLNVGLTNKTAAAISTAPVLTPDVYCMALSSPNLKLHGKVIPKPSQEQIDFCHEIEKKETHDK